MATLDCESARRLTHLELDGELRDADARLLKQHLETCEQCRRHRDEMARVEAALREGLTQTSLTEPAVAQARRMTRRSRTTRALWSTWLPAAAAFVLVALAVLVGVPMMQGPRQPAAPAVVVSGGNAIHVFEPNHRTAQPGRTGTRLREKSVAWGLGDEPIALEFVGGARVGLSDEAVVRIGRVSIDLFKGNLRADLTRAGGDFTVVTPWGEFSGAGSLFLVHSDAEGARARVTVIAGEVQVARRGWQRVLSAGEAVTLKPDPKRTIAL